jgi:hypothetical protein
LATLARTFVTCGDVVSNCNDRVFVFRDVVARDFAIRSCYYVGHSVIITIGGLRDCYQDYSSID